MDLDLDGTAAIVCGASSGIGFAIARALAREGAAVTMCARDAARLREAAGTIEAEAGAAPQAIAGDVRDAALLERLVVNNAGGPPGGTFESTPDEAWAEAFELSLRSAVRLTRLALPHLRRSGRGRVVNIASSSVREPIPGLLLSSAIRPGVVGWAKTLAHELGPDGITVNTIAPGRIDTERVREVWLAKDDPEAARAADMAAIPARRVGSPDEVAAVVAFLCSRPAAYVSGAVVPVDGGLLRGVW